MSAPCSAKVQRGKCVVFVLLSLLCLLALSAPTLTQTVSEKRLQARASDKEMSKVIGSDSREAERRAFAVALVRSLADEARSYHDLSLRPHVLALAADTLWDADGETARTLFSKAWDAAEKGDAEELSFKKDGAPPMVIGLKRMSGRDLRSEVLMLAARRDHALGEEFLGKLVDKTKRESADSTNEQPSGNTSDSGPSVEAASKRLQLASKLLDDGEVERALEFAAPALDQVNANSIGFLSALRGKRPEVADQRFAFLLARAEFDPSSDANTVSGLSSYAFTPGFYVTFSADGGAHWIEGESETTASPNLPAPLRQKFFHVASTILLRPLPPPDQDSTSSGRAGKYMVVKRLLPLFDQYTPDLASALRAQQTASTGDPSRKGMGDDSFLLGKGLQPEETAGNALEKMQDRLDHAKTSRERDLIYADAAVVLAHQGDARAPVMADKIEDSERRAQIRRYVDFEFVRRAIQKKEASEVARLAKAGQLTHTQRAWSYTQAARLLMNTPGPRALELLEEAADEARRIDGNDSERALMLIGVVTQLITADRVRAWEIMSEAVKSANSTEEFTGENVQLTFPLMTKSGVKFTSIGGEEFGLSNLFRTLAKNDLYRSIDLAKSFKNEAPRAAATLAIASAVLKKQTVE